MSAQDTTDASKNLFVRAYEATMDFYIPRPNIESMERTPAIFWLFLPVVYTVSLIMEIVILVVPTKEGEQ